jgi:predicted TIM-barrel fold metal-dependent hydrolase
MAMDGISAELLFPTIAKGIYDQASDDPDLAAACDRTYNDWLIEYCQEAPERLWGQAFIGLWNMDYAVKELERTRSAGLKAATIWVIPPDELSFTSDHYERFWSAAEDLDMPISMHINTGFGLYAEGSDARPEGGAGANQIASAARRAFGHKAAVAQTVTEMILSGVFERHPRLKLIMAEFGVGWIPYWLEDLDRKSAGAQRGLPLKPSEYFNRQVYATFEQDGVGGYLLERWGADNFMWANDYPHGGGIWPYSDDTIALTLGHLSQDVRRKVLGENMARVFGLPMPEPMPRQPIPDNAETIWSRPWLKRVGEYTFEKPVMGL